MEIPDKLRLWMYGPAMIHVEAEPIEPRDYDQLPRLREGLLDIMRRHRGIGISAPQVGLFYNYVVIELADRTILDFVNPYIEEMHGYEPKMFEACLSLPPTGNGYEVPRMEHITVIAGSAKSPSMRERYCLSSLDARVAQHEIDHLSGVFFIDRIGDKAREKVLRSYNRWKEQRERTTYNAGDNATGNPVLSYSANLPYMR